jgi:anti-sigma B factor antagonist
MKIFTCAVDIDDQHAVAHLNGELDMSTVRCLVERLRPIAAAGRDLVVDLAGISFFGTAGLGALDELDRYATAAGGSIRLSHVPALVWRLLAVTGSANRFDILEQKPNLPAPRQRNTQEASYFDEFARSESSRQREALVGFNRPI